MSREEIDQHYVEIAERDNKMVEHYMDMFEASLMHSRELRNAVEFHI